MKAIGLEGCIPALIKCQYYDKANIKDEEYMNKKHCLGCYNNFYNGDNNMGIKKCWNLETAKLVERIKIGHWEEPPYLNKEKVLVPDCFRGEGSNRIHYVDPQAINSDGYWK